MKKIISIIATISLLLTLCMNVNATTYENSAFIGSWVAYSANGTPNAYLYVDFCDSERIKCRFETVRDNEIERAYDIYQCDINDTKAKGKFYTTKSSNNWHPTGTCEIELMRDMIKFTIVSSNNINLYSGLFKSTAEDFNSQKSPYNHNVNILVNDAPINCELKPFILKDRTYVPLRGVFEALGVEVIWNDTKADNIHTHQIIAKKADIEVSITKENKNSNGFGSWQMTKTQGDTKTDVDLTKIQPVIIKDNTYIPLRAVVECFGTYIDWNDATRTVIISDTVPPTPLPEETPATGEEPQTSDEPQISEEPQVSEEPQTSEEPQASKEPQASEEPQESEEPQVSETPTPTQEPSADDEK